MRKFDPTLVGRRFKSGNGVVYTCTAVDWRDVTLVSEIDPKDVRRISDGVIGKTFHEVHADGSCALISPVQ